MFPFLIRFESFTIKRVVWLCPSFGPLTCAVGFCFWLPGGHFSPFPFLENYYWKNVGNLCPKELWPVSGGLGSATACDLGGLFVCGWSVWETALPGWSFLGASCHGHLCYNQSVISLNSRISKECITVLYVAFRWTRPRKLKEFIVTDLTKGPFCFLPFSLSAPPEITHLKLVDNGWFILTVL